MRPGVILGGVLAALLATAADARSEADAAPQVEIVQPADGQPLFDRVQVEATVRAERPLVAVELWLDGRQVAVSTAAPYAWQVDVGAENRSHTLRVVARDDAGAVGTAERISPAVQIDEQLDLGLRQVYLTVTDRQRRRVLDLRRDELTLLDEGVVQEIVTFEGGDIPFTGILLVDGSASMEGEPLRTALASARRFVDGMRRLDEARVLVFSDRLLFASPWFAAGADDVEARLETAQAAGGTAIFDHLYLALSWLEERQGRRVVILLSDGWDLHSVLDGEQLRRVAGRSQAMVYWVRLGDEPEPPDDGQRRPARQERRRRATATAPMSSWRSQEQASAERARLEQLVTASGGRIVSVPDVDGIAAAFSDVLGELRQQIVLGYYPQPRRKDGAWRRIAVRLARPGLDVRTREGYVDD